LERFNLFALEFLHDSVNRLILAALYLDASSTRQIETYELVLNTSSNDYTLRPGPFRVTNLETSTDFISRVEPPYGGILAASHTGVRYINGRQPTLDVKLPSPMKIEAFNRVLHDKHVYLLADKTGRLFRVEILATSNAPGPGGFGQVQELKLKHLGQTSIASCLCYLDQRMVFVGSHYADSQLVRLPVQEGEGVEVLDRLCNLSPVVDFAVLQNNESSQVFFISFGVMPSVFISFDLYFNLKTGKNTVFFFSILFLAQEYMSICSRLIQLFRDGLSLVLALIIMGHCVYFVMVWESQNWRPSIWKISRTSGV
jgi:hypothetical protein